MTSRYFVSSHLNQYVVKDRKMQNAIIATCVYREQAKLVAVALNNDWWVSAQVKSEDGKKLGDFL